MPAERIGYLSDFASMQGDNPKKGAALLGKELDRDISKREARPSPSRGGNNDGAVEFLGPCPADSSLGKNYHKNIGIYTVRNLFVISSLLTVYSTESRINK
jgi:hypothetical protein